LSVPVRQESTFVFANHCRSSTQTKKQKIPAMDHSRFVMRVGVLLPIGSLRVLGCGPMQIVFFMLT
jgi:hypothetical protein